MIKYLVFLIILVIIVLKTTNNKTKDLLIKEHMTEISDINAKLNIYADEIAALKLKCNNITANVNGITKLQFGQGYTLTQEGNDTNPQLYIRRPTSNGKIVFTIGDAAAYGGSMYIQTIMGTTVGLQLVTFNDGNTYMSNNRSRGANWQN